MVWAKWSAARPNLALYRWAWRWSWMLGRYFWCLVDGWSFIVGSFLRSGGACTTLWSITFWGDIFCWIDVGGGDVITTLVYGWIGVSGGWRITTLCWMTGGGNGARGGAEHHKICDIWIKVLAMGDPYISYVGQWFYLACRIFSMSSAVFCG